MDIKIENEDDSYAEYPSTSCSMDNQHVEPESDSNTARMHQQLLGLGCNISIDNMLEIKKERENTMSDNESNADTDVDPAQSLIDIEGKIIRIKTEPVDDTDENTWGQFMSLKRKNKLCSESGQDEATARKKKKKKERKSRENKKDNNKGNKEEMDYRNRSSPLLNIGNQLPRWKNIASEFKFNDVKVAEGLIDSYYYVKRGDAAKAMFGQQYIRWLKVRKSLNLNTHEELSEFLLNSYYSKMCTTQQTPEESYYSKMCTTQQTPEESVTTTSNQKTTKESDSTPRSSNNRQSEDDIGNADYTFNCASCGGEWLNRKKYKKHVAICNRSRMVKHVVEADCAINANVVTYDVRDDGRLVEKNQRKTIQLLGLSRKETIIEKKSHQAKDATQKSYKAKICNEHLPSTSKSYIDSVGHDANTGRNPSLFNCEKCRKTFATENSLIGHICQSIKTKLSLKPDKTRMHIDTTPKDYKRVISVIDAMKFFENKSLLNIHMKTHRDAVPEKNELICSLCEEVFLNRVIFKKHMNSVHKEVECNVCQKVLSNAEKLKRHMKFMHDETKPFQCDWPVCRRNFENKSKLDNHIMIRHKSVAVPVKERIDGRNRKGKFAAKKGTKIRCSLCRNMYCLTEETFQRHMRSFHGKLLKTCDVCGETFRWAIFEDHMEMKHNGIKIFKCDICKMTFAEKSMFDIHVKIHRRKYPLQTCTAFRSFPM